MAMHSNLKAHLEPLLRRQALVRLWLKLAACWGIATLLGLGAFVLQYAGVWSLPFALPIIAIAGAVAALVITLRNGRHEPNWRGLARRIEIKHPELDGRLLTAVQQE